MGAMSDILSHMKTVAVRELTKQWNQVLRENAGTEVPITNRGEIVAYLRVLPRKKGQKIQIPDFRHRLQTRFGKRTISESDARQVDQASRSRY